MRGATRRHAQSVSEQASVVRWPWNDPWGGQFMTRTRAALESDHARQMFDQSMLHTRPTQTQPVPIN